MSRSNRPSKRTRYRRFRRRRTIAEKLCVRCHRKLDWRFGYTVDRQPLCWVCVGQHRT